MCHQIGDRIALRDDGAAPAGSSGTITKDYRDGHYDVEVTHTPPPERKEREITVTAIYVEVLPIE